MPRFVILIDDGEMIPANMGTSYPNMDAAVEVTMKVAMSIASQRATWNHANQLVHCEIRECETSHRREFDVLLRRNEIVKMDDGGTDQGIYRGSV